MMMACVQADDAEGKAARADDRQPKFKNQQNVRFAKVKHRQRQWQRDKMIQPEFNSFREVSDGAES